MYPASKKKGIFPNWGYADRNDPIFMEDGHSAESHEISILQFFIIELWLIVFTIYEWYTWIFKCVTDQKKKSFKSGQMNF